MDLILERLRAEFLEMPGLRLTAQQVHRLCGVEPATCRTALDILVREKFLCAKPDGTYTRLTEGELRSSHQVKAEFERVGASWRQAS